MKRNLTLVFVCMLLLVSLAGCRDANQFEETTLTFVNDSDINVDKLGFEGYWFASNMRIVDDSDEEDVIAPGESIVVGIPPVLAEQIPLRIFVEYDLDYISCNLFYEEGADVVLTLISVDGDGAENFTIEGGELREDRK